MVQDNPEENELPKLEVKCSSTNCKEGLHYFGPANRKRLKSPYPVGICRDCGESLVDWTRVHQRVVADLPYLFDMLRREYWRHEWWHRPIDRRTRIKALEKGATILRQDIPKVLAKSIGSPEQFRDGTQTKLGGNIIYYAQHATGTCCRKCLAYWHGIELNERVSDEQMGYLGSIVMRYIQERMPDLREEGQKAPRSNGRKTSRVKAEGLNGGQ